MNQRVGKFVCVVSIIFCMGASAFAQMSGGMGNGAGSGPFIGFQGHNMDHDLILPQVAVGQQYTTSLLLLNMGNPQLMNWVAAQNLTTSGKVYFYRQDGTPLSVSVNHGAAASEIAFSLDASKSVYWDLSYDGPDTSGWALIDVDEPASGSGWGMMDGQPMTRGMRLMAEVFYTFSGTGQPTSRVGVVPSMYEMGKFSTSMVSALSRDDLYTGVAIVNTGATAATVTLRLIDSNGNQLATTPLTLNPGSQVAKFINELFPSVPADFLGFVKVDSSDEGIVTMGLLVGQGILTSVPTSHYGRVSMMQ